MRSIRGADGLRALACLMVVLHHLVQRLALPSFGPEVQGIAAVFLTGFSGVTIFFVLSGFLLSHPFWEAWAQGGSLPDLRVYALRRAARILPGFYFNLFFCFLLSLALVPGAPALVLRYFAGLTLTSGFHWLTLFPTELNGPLWSVGFEVFSYLLMPVGMVGLFALLGKKRTFGRALGWWTLLLAAVLGVNQVIQEFCVPDSLGRGWEYGMVGGAKVWSPYYNLVGWFAHFCIGTLAAGVSVGWSRSRRAQAWAVRGFFDGAAGGLVVLWVVFIVSAVGKGEYYLGFQHQPAYFPWFTLINGLLLACLSQSRFLGGFFDHPFARFTARISFGLYLWHMAVMEIFRVLFWPGYSNGGTTDLGLWALASAAVLVTAYSLAALSWFFFERPILNRAHRWTPGPRDPGPVRKTTWAVLAAAAVLVAVPLAADRLFPGAHNPADAFFPKAGTELPIPEGRGTLTIRVTRILKNGGRILLAVFGPGNMDEQSMVRKDSLDPKGQDTLVFTFTDLPFGHYAVEGFQDEDGDGHLKLSPSGRPLEGCVSSNGLGPSGPPLFSQDKFRFDRDLTLDRPVFYFDR